MNNEFLFSENAKKIVAVTNRHICRKSYEKNLVPHSGQTEPLLMRLHDLCHTDIKFIILREKDLPEDKYMELAKSALEISSAHNKLLVLHSYVHVAASLNHMHIHLPLNHLEKLNASDVKRFTTVGVSVHSMEDAVKAEAFGASYLTAGHIFDTDCKKGIAGRGLSFLRDVCSSVSIPVYAIGGITPDNLPSVLDAGANGGCMMSGAMNYSVT